MIDVLILIHVEELCADEQGNVVDADADQDFIPLPVHGFVVVAVDLEEVRVIVDQRHQPAAGTGLMHS